MEKKLVASVFAALTYGINIASINANIVGDATFAINRESSYYFGNAYQLNWYKAAEHCRAQGLFLVSIQEEKELNDVIEYVKKSGYFDKYNDLQMWTSGNDLGQSGQQYWSSTGERITFDRFADGEPSNTKYPDGSYEDCIVLERSKGRNFTFDDRPCKKEYYFMCENRVC